MRGPVGRHRDGVLPVGGQAAVSGRHGPAIRLHACGVITQREHRLDGQAQADLDAATLATGAVVGDLRFLVHLVADAVPDVGTHDAVAMLEADVLDGAGDVLEGVARQCRADTRQHRLAGRGHELLLPPRSTSPTSQVRALSPCQPSTIAPQSTETT